MFRPYFAAHVLETAFPSFHVEVGGVRGQVLRVHVQLDMAARHSQVGFRVVLHVVGAQPVVLVSNFDVAVGKKYVAFLALLLGFEADRSLAGWRDRPWRQDLSGDAGRRDTACKQEAEGPSGKRADDLVEGNHF